MIFLFLLLAPFAFGKVPIHWSALTEIRERHEFYKENEVLKGPAGSWQTLFGVVYPDRALRTHKDCVYYKVPVNNDGALKIKALPMDVPCESKSYEQGDSEVTRIKALQFSIGRDLVLHFTFDTFRTTKWIFPLINQLRRSEPVLLSSSAEYKAPKMILLAPVTKGEVLLKAQKDGELCHSVSDDCKVLAPSSCHLCAEGWYEIPNGCASGPKYCGNITCGLRNGPACRRGMVYQRIEKAFDCQTDSSFAYCRPGLTVQCEGTRAYCR